MEIAALLEKINALLGDVPRHAKKIVALLKPVAHFAESDVIRTAIARPVREAMDRVLRLPDRRKRVEAVQLACDLLPARMVVLQLQRFSRHPDPLIRFATRRALRTLRVRDVALPDVRFAIKGTTPFRLGDWNASGWSAGYYREWRTSSRYKFKVVRTKAARKRATAPMSDRKGLPALKDRAALLKLLSLDDATFRRFSRPGASRGSAYVEFDMAKATGGVRRIAAPRPRLKAVQRALYHALLSKPPTHNASHGYVRGRSVLSNAQPHVNAALVIKTDLRDFFPSVHYHRVVGLLRLYGYTPAVGASIARLVTYRPVDAKGKASGLGVLPQGAPTSPAIANLVCRRLDARLHGLATRAGGTYTRYADDLTFSFRADPPRGIGRFFWWVSQICLQEGFIEHAGKRKVLRRANRQQVTGVVVNQAASVPREVRRTLRAMLHRARTKGAGAVTNAGTNVRSYLFGLAGYVRMVQPAQGAKLMDEVRALFPSDPTPATVKVKEEVNPAPPEKKKRTRRVK